MVFHGVISERVFLNRYGEAAVGGLLVIVDAMVDLAEGGSVREIHEADERFMRVVGRGRVSPNEFVAVNHLSIRKGVMTNEEPLLPTGTVIGGVLRLDVNLGLVVGGIHAFGNMVSIVAGTVVVNGGFRQRRGGSRRNQSRERGKE